MPKQLKVYSRAPEIMIAMKLVETHEKRKENVELLTAERESLEEAIPGGKLKPVVTSRSGVSDPVYLTYKRMEKIDEILADELRRIEVVDRAIGNIGAFEDPAVRQQMQEAILLNVQAGGERMPFEYVNYPSKYGRKIFYEQRKMFLTEIAKGMNLIIG